MTARRVGLAIAGIVVGAGTFLLTFWRVGWSGGPTFSARVGWGEIASVMAHARIGWLVAFLAVNAGSIPFRAWQLQALARRSDGSRPRYWPCLRAVAVGN